MACKVIRFDREVRRAEKVGSAEVFHGLYSTAHFMSGGLSQSFRDKNVRQR